MPLVRDKNVHNLLIYKVIENYLVFGKIQSWCFLTHPSTVSTKASNINNATFQHCNTLIRVCQKTPTLDFPKKQISFPLHYISTGCISIFRQIQQDLGLPF